MNIWFTLLLVVHVVTAIAIIGLVLLQHGKGADVGAAFGGGASGSLFGATGSANFLSRATAILATVFFLTSLGLTYVATHKPAPDAGVMEKMKDGSAVPSPSAPAPAQGESKDNSIPVPADGRGAGANPKSGEVPK